MPAIATYFPLSLSCWPSLTSLMTPVSYIFLSKRYFLRGWLAYYSSLLICPLLHHFNCSSNTGACSSSPQMAAASSRTDSGERVEDIEGQGFDQRFDQRSTLAPPPYPAASLFGRALQQGALRRGDVDQALDALSIRELVARMHTAHSITCWPRYCLIAARPHTH